MKTRFVLLVLIMMAKLAYPQICNWTTPVPFTDSVSDNRNATIQWIKSSGQTFAFWEKSNDSAATAIAGRIILPSSPSQPPFVVLSQPGVHFRYPQVYVQIDNYPSSSDTLFYLFYESDENGSPDIYYVKYLSGGTFTTPVAFATGPDEDRHLAVFNCNNCYQGGVTWESKHCIYYARRDVTNHCFLPPQLIDSGNDQNPVIGAEIIAWEKKVNDSSKVWFSSWSYTNLKWGQPAQMYGQGDNTALSLYKINMDGGPTADICWQNQLQGTTGLVGFEGGSYLGWSQFFDSHSPSNNKTSPSGINLMLIIKKASWGNMGLATFASDSTGNEEIFVSDWLTSSLFHNISNSTAIDRHPQLFYAGVYLGFLNTVYNVWESFRNGHWTLFSTHFDFSNDIEDLNKASTDVFLQVYPNPFSGEVTFRVHLDHNSFVKCAIYDVFGKRIRTFMEMNPGAGITQLNWDGKNDNDVPVAAGTYFLKLETDIKTFHQKLIRQ